MDDAAKILHKMETANTAEAAGKGFFTFQPEEIAGPVSEVETGHIEIQITDPSKVERINVGRLVVIESTSPEKKLVGRLEKVFSRGKTKETQCFYAAIGLVGSLALNLQKGSFSFSRSLIAVPVIGSSCYLLEGEKLTLFMTSISVKDENASLTLGKFSLDEGVDAYMDGDKLFQRHMALVGSSGCGKSWTVAALVEQIAKKPSANIVLFDIHGEYQALWYAEQVRLATPADLENPDKDVLFLPTWFMSHEELMTLFLDKTDPDCATQSLMINETIRKRKLQYLKEHDLTELQKAFTADSPIPYDFRDVLNDIKYLNTELIPGIGQGEVVKGPFFGRFDRLIPKLEAKLTDKRYGFMFSGPRAKIMDYRYLNTFAAKLMSAGLEPDGHNHGIKIINLSMAPSELLPHLIAIVGRFLFNIQFWSTGDYRHPIVLVCDECHLYLPPIENCNEAQRNCVFQFGRIAKEGRKYGIVLAAVTQRPSDLNPTILSQCGNLLTLRLTNASDQEIVKKMMPDGMNGLVEELPLLAIGELIPIGDSVVLPLKTKVTPAQCPPTSVTPTYASTWSLPQKKIGLDEGIDNMRKQFRKNAFD
jgi:hypothetical protein